MTASKSIKIPPVPYAMLQEITEKNHIKLDQYLTELVKKDYEKKR